MPCEAEAGKPHGDGGEDVQRPGLRSCLGEEVSSCRGEGSCAVCVGPVLGVLARAKHLVPVYQGVGELPEIHHDRHSHRRSSGICLEDTQLEVRRILLSSHSILSFSSSLAVSCSLNLRQDQIEFAEEEEILKRKIKENL